MRSMLARRAPRIAVQLQVQRIRTARTHFADFACERGRSSRLFSARSAQRASKHARARC